MIRLNNRAVSGFALGDRFPANVVSAAQAAANAIGADVNYCQSVMQPGTPANVALHAFKLAWNAMPGKYIPAGIFYDSETAFALKQVLGAAPTACLDGSQKSPPPDGVSALDNTSTPPPSYVPPHPTPVAIKALVAGAVGAVAGAGMSYADTRTVRASAVSYGAVIGVIGALVATAMK
jgi:hypothetical protein